METVQFKGNEVHTSGTLPKQGAFAPDFTLTKEDLSSVNLYEFKEKKIVLSVFPSIDTEVCASSVRKFNEMISGLNNILVLCISKDLPFAQKRFCAAKGLDKVIMLSDFKDDNFSKDYGLKIINGPLTGLLARSVIILDEDKKIIYEELVNDISLEPNYKEAFASFSLNT